ncbi:MAG: hypothetical protein GX159_01485 [Flavobacteriaceae bacterium]|jgi:hypothetical protein|nr:hypothetical protein [Flavobacteriaceae bacterium]
MKKLIRIFYLFLGLTFITACAPKRPPHPKPPHKVLKAEKKKKLPPGQVKKIRGSKSAKPYAPGQIKKQKHKKQRKPIRSGS